MLEEDGQEIERGDGTALWCSEVGRILCRSVSTQLCHNLRERGRAGHSLEATPLYLRLRWWQWWGLRSEIVRRLKFINCTMQCCCMPLNAIIPLVTATTAKKNVTMPFCHVKCIAYLYLKMKNVSFDEMLVVPSHQLIVKKDIENNMGHQQAVKEHIFSIFSTHLSQF